MRRFSVFLSSIALSCGLLVALSPAEATIPPTPESLASMSASTKTTLAVGSDGLAYGIGKNSSGQLTGSGDRSELTVMLGLPPGVSAAAVSAGFEHSVVIGSDGVPYATGNNSAHEITGIDTANRNTLTPMTGLPPGITAVKAHASRWDQATLIIGSDGIPYVVGNNAFSKLGGSFTTLTAVPGWPGGVEAIDGEITYAGLFLVGDNGNLYGRGGNSNFQGPGDVGVGSTGALVSMDLPIDVNAVGVEASDNSTFIIGDDGKAYGKGHNGGGEIGYGNEVPSFKEVGTDNDGENSSLLPEGTHVVQIAAGAEHEIMLLSNGKVYGTGNNLYGQLPNVDYDKSKYELQELGESLAGDVTAVVAGSYHTVVGDHEGIVYGSGRNNNGQLGGSAQTYFALRVLPGQFITNIDLPTISGSAQFTKTLTVNPGTWSPSVKEFDYQWKKDGGAIVDATGPTYQLTSDDIGSTISVMVTAQRGRLGEGVATSGETAAVAVGPALAYTSTTKPKVTGTLKSGYRLSISRTSSQMMLGFNPDATSLKYKWYRGSSAISGATYSTYKLTSKDKGKKIRVRIYGLKPFYATGSYLTATVTIKS